MGRRAEACAVRDRCDRTMVRREIGPAHERAIRTTVRFARNSSRAGTVVHASRAVGCMRDSPGSTHPTVWTNWGGLHRCLGRETCEHGEVALDIVAYPFDLRADKGAALAGRHAPRSGQWASRCGLPKPQAFIIPTWQREKSKRTGSAASISRSDAVISAAIFQPGLV